MSTIVTRSGKGSPLTNTEVDSNFQNLNTDKAELSGAVFTGAITTNSTIDGRDVATDGTKLDGVEASADVTDTANVTAAGALMDSELTSIASVKALNQGVATTDSPTFAAVTANAGVVVDNITIDGNEIDVGSGDLTLDVAGNLLLNADGGGIYFQDASLLVGSFINSSSNFVISNEIADKDIILRGIDGSTTIDALTLDMSAAGAATFNSEIRATSATINSKISIYTDSNGAEIDNNTGNFTIDTPGEIHLDSDSGIIRVRDGGGDYGMFQISNSDLIVRSMVQDKDLLFKGNDNGSVITALTLDMSAAGFATFNNGIRANRDIASFGANTGSSANRMAMSMEGAGVSRLICNGPDGSTNGTFEVFTAVSGGTGSVKLGIDSSGSINLGVTTPTHQTDSLVIYQPDNYALYSGSNGTGGSNHMVFGNANSWVGSITTNGSATQYLTSSDYRLKENVVPMTGSIDRVKALKPSRFNFIVDADKTVDGFLAHEAQEVVPEAATGTKDAMRDEEYEVTAAVYEDVTTPAVEAVDAVVDEDGVVITEAVEAVAETTESVLTTEAVMGTRSVPDMQGIDQAKLVPLLTAALQEAITKIESLTARIEALEA